MQRIINAIAKGQKEGLYSLEEIADILQAIDQVGRVVKQYNENQEALQKEKNEVNPIPKPKRGPNESKS